MSRERDLSWYLLGAAACIGLNARAQAAAPDAAGGIVQARTPPALRALPAPASAQLAAGRAVYSRHWVPAGAAGVGQGLGPLFNADSCAACHGEHGEGGDGPATDGPAPPALVVQLEGPAPASGAEPPGDPLYGHVLNTAAAAGLQPEGAVTIRYSGTEGQYYPEGFHWRMRVPHYELSGLSRGPLARTTVIKPRLAPPLFGVGLLDAVPAAAIADAAPHVQSGSRRGGEPAWILYRGVRTLGRFGWQGRSLAVRDQTAKAFAREMGLTTSDRPRDDCTPAEADCWQPREASSPEVVDELLDAVVSYVGALAVPESPARAPPDSPGAELFATIGCAQCHRPELPVELTGADGQRTRAVIAAYSDLLLHDLGAEMADYDASGARVPSRWRTAPLWGLGYRSHRSGTTFLHDGRARNLEEAILWHSAEGARARHNFVALFPRQREALLHWLEAL
jgi:CxxC motif-containing protein (DUF1111 family)